ncbi:MAG: radical protein [Myxococcales bacterium]|nr:radical protein [Myxococcales bacterium]
MMKSVVRVATIVDDTLAEGPGRRWALWVQGCPIRCAGCCNPEMFDERGGTEWSVADLLARIPSEVEGVTFLGGEPFTQATELAALARAVKARGLTVMVFSGYPLAELQARADAAALLACIDLLVDAPYDRERPEPRPPVGRRWIGSTNQTMHFLTPAYSPDDPRMREANTIEIRISRAALLINGWPSAQQLVKRR